MYNFTELMLELAKAEPIVTEVDGIVVIGIVRQKDGSHMPTLRYKGIFGDDDVRKLMRHVSKNFKTKTVLTPIEPPKEN